MKSFVFKCSIISVSVIVIYNLTIKEPIDKILDITSLVDSSVERKLLRNNIKKSLRSEMKSAIDKDKILYDEDRLLIKNFIEKILLELEININ